MHEVIIQLEEEPLRFEEDFACEEDFYDEFVGTVADYVSEDVDREEKIEYFVENLKKYGITYNPKDQSIIFHKGFKEKYFAEKFFKLKEAVQELTLEDFVRDTSKVQRIEDLINKKYNTYIYTKNTWMTIDEFLRYSMEEERAYYIGSVIDYHF